MLDNVVEVNGLPLEPNKDGRSKASDAMGWVSWVWAQPSLCSCHRSTVLLDSLAFTEQVVTRELAVVGWRVALELAREKGAAPVLEEKLHQ